jgi:hypothetical protein
MSNVQDLQARVDKSSEKVEKCKATIKRHEDQLTKKLAVVATNGVTLDNMEEKKWLGGVAGSGGSALYWDICQVESKQDDIKGANRKLRDAEEILSNWQAKLNVAVEQVRFIEGNAPQVIKDFMEEWKQKVYAWSVKRYADYQVFKVELQEKKQAAQILYIETHPEQYSRYLDNDGKITQEQLSWATSRNDRDMDKYLKEKGLDYRSIQAKEADYAGGRVLTMCTYYNEVERLAWLEKELEREKQVKLLDLVQRINAVVGTITDASYLSISPKGNLDGFVTGENGRAKIETIGAGGYNIQCYHFRTLVHKIA